MFPSLQAFHQQPSGLQHLRKLSILLCCWRFLHTSVGLASGTASSSDTDSPVVLVGSVCEPACPAFSGGYVDILTCAQVFDTV